LTAITPGTPPPPPRFSTITCWPQSAVNRSASMRENVSAACPGGKGTTMRTGLVG
jgi:hypothetical protein